LSISHEDGPRRLPEENDDLKMGFIADDAFIEDVGAQGYPMEAYPYSIDSRPILTSVS